MKIGILTFHNIPNFGAILQAYSLCTALRDLGYECEIIDYQCDSIIDRELTYHPHSNKLKDFILRNMVWPVTEKKIAACRRFMSDRNMYSTTRYDKNSIFKANEKYDIFFSGSDMIWDFSVTKSDKTYLLDFTFEDKLRYSYGSSCGDNVWKEQDMKTFLSLLKRYQGIAVREETMRCKLQSIGLGSKLVADPTLLLKPEKWREIAKAPKTRKYVLVYFPTEKNLDAASRYAKKRGLKKVVLNWGIPMFKYLNAAPLSPQEWVGYVMNAEAVFTDSYHGFLFALYFNKPVWIGKTGNRFSSMIDYLEISGVELDKDPLLSNKIDFNHVNAQLNKMREDSLDYLRFVRV